MSFILDALKKSENDRQRQSGPALFEVRVAPPRSRFPSWAIALVALLVVNLAVIGWLMFRKPAAAATPPMQAATPAPVPAPVAVAPAPVQPAPAPQPAYIPPATAQVAPRPPVQEQGPTLEQEPPGAGTAEGNPDDYAPASEPSGDGPVAQVTRGLENGLMTYQEAATKNQIPPLKMDLHVYAPDPRQRFVLVNMRRLTEGQSLPDGVKVDRITTDGAVLSYRGVQFMMERD